MLYVNNHYVYDN